MTIQFTPNYQLPYPQLSDTADVPRDVGALAVTVDTKVKTVEQADSDRVPIGAMMMWATAVAPTSWVICDGSSKNRSGVSPDGNNYSALWTVIGTAYGSVDGATFNLPDLRSRVPIGSGPAQAAPASLSARALAVKSASTGAQATLGEETHTLTGHESGVNDNGGTTSSGSHSHSIGSQWMLASVPGLQTTPGVGMNPAAIPVGPDGAHSHPLSSRPADTPHNNMPPFLVINFIMRFK